MNDDVDSGNVFRRVIQLFACVTSKFKGKETQKKNILHIKRKYNARKTAVVTLKKQV
jgi:hypothetical protein